MKDQLDANRLCSVCYRIPDLHVYIPASIRVHQVVIREPDLSFTGFEFRIQYETFPVSSNVVGATAVDKPDMFSSRWGRKNRRRHPHLLPARLRCDIHSRRPVLSFSLIGNSRVAFPAAMARSFAVKAFPGKPLPIATTTLPVVPSFTSPLIPSSTLGE